MPLMALTAHSMVATTPHKMAYILIHHLAVSPVYLKSFPGRRYLTDSILGNEACGTIKPANVISTSYSYDEADLTVFYATRQCAEYAKLGLMGVTVLYSSGDFGVAGNGGNCLNPDGQYPLFSLALMII
jgi:hypothetical protein